MSHLAFNIALRYLRAKKSHSAVNVITIISVAGVAVASMAMVVVMSIFNGFSDLADAHLSAIDPDVKITRNDGRVIDDAATIARDLSSRVTGVRGAVVTLSSRALLVDDGEQMPIIFRGVPDEYATLSHIDDIIIDGMFALATTDSVSGGIISVGVANTLKLAPGVYHHVKIYVPRRRGRINPANPMAAFTGTTMAVSGVFATQQSDYDADYVLIPLSAAQTLLDYDDTTGDAIEVFADPGTDIDALKQAVKDIIGDDYAVCDTIEQHAESFRMISIEKWITFMMLTFILVIALFNIVSTLSLLIIEKRDNMVTMRALGADDSLVRRIFMLEGWLITLIGGIVGIILGIALTIAQQYGGFITLAGDTAKLSVTAYPVRLDVIDVIATALAVAATGLLASQSARIFLRKKKGQSLRR